MCMWLYGIYFAVIFTRFVCEDGSFFRSRFVFVFICRFIAWTCKILLCLILVDCNLCVCVILLHNAKLLNRRIVWCFHLNAVFIWIIRNLLVLLWKKYFCHRIYVVFHKKQCGWKFGILNFHSFAFIKDKFLLYYFLSSHYKLSYL